MAFIGSAWHYLGDGRLDAACGEPSRHEDWRPGTEIVSFDAGSNESAERASMRGNLDRLWFDIENEQMRDDCPVHRSPGRMPGLGQCLRGGIDGINVFDMKV
jgi:hypothetical protein